MGGWDLHIHTTFCDGDSTPEEMVQAAMERGLEGIGFSGHAPMPFDAPWAMTPAGAAEYWREVSRLKEKYRGRIKILLGPEPGPTAWALKVTSTKKRLLWSGPSSPTRRYCSTCPLSR